MRERFLKRNTEKEEDEEKEKKKEERRKERKDREKRRKKEDEEDEEGEWETVKGGMAIPSVSYIIVIETIVAFMCVFNRKSQKCLQRMLRLI